MPFTHSSTALAREAAIDTPSPAPNQLMEEFLAKASRTSPISEFIETVVAFAFCKLRHYMTFLFLYYDTKRCEI